MALIPISHARRLRSSAEASSLVRALGEKRVGMRGLHTMDPTKIERVIAAVIPKHDHTISFEGGSLATARQALDRLAHASYDYLDLRTPSTNLRIWPALRSWVQVDGEPLFETTSIAAALERFHAVSGDAHHLGFVMRIAESTKEPLAAFVRVLGATVHALIEVELAVARELTELYAGEALEWTADGIFIRFPHGEIAGFLKTPNVDDKHRAKWQAQIDKAIRKAKI